MNKPFKISLTIIIALAVVLPLFAHIYYSGDKVIIEDFISNIYKLPKDSIKDISLVKFKTCYHDEYFKMVKEDASAGEYLMFQNKLYEDSVSGYPTEFIGTRCRKVTFTDSTTHNILIYFKGTKLHAGFTVTTLDLHNTIEFKKKYANY